MTLLTVKGSEYHTGNGSVNRNPNSDTPDPERPKPTLASHGHESSSQSIISTTETAPNDTSIDNLGTDASELQSPASEEDSASFITSLQLIKDLDLFLATAPVNWHENQVIRRYFLNKEEGFVSCVYWNNLYFITGTDIVRCIAYKMCHIGRQIVDRKKFEEGVFSDLRALKCGSQAVLENSRSPFLKFLHRNQCLRTQKKQKVFIWFSVPHEKLFADVLERDFKREISNQPATTKPINSIFQSFKYDLSQPLLEQLFKHFSQHLKSDVSHLLLKSNSILSAATESPKNNFKSETNSVKQEESQYLRTQQSSDLSSSLQDHASYFRMDGDFAPHAQMQYPNYQQTQFNTDQTIISDDFPLNLLESESALLNSNYLAVDNGLKSGGVLNDGQPLVDGTVFSPKRNSQYQILQNFNGDGVDIQFMNAFSQSLLPSAGYQQPGNQPMYVLSGLPSAIDPHTTMGSFSQGHSAGVSQFVQLPFQQNQMMTSPSNIMYSNENGATIDGALFHTGDPQIFSQLMRSQSPSLSSNTNTQFANVGQPGLIPVYMPVQSAVKEEFPQTTEDQNQFLQVEIDPALKDSTNASNEVDVTAPKTKPSDHIPNKTNIKPQSPSSDEKKPQLHDSQNARQDYMMLQVPQLNNVSRVNFGIMNGQLFTPGAFGINPALSAGVGISPVIGFNNGMLSAIQYQPKRPSFERSSSVDMDDENAEENDLQADAVNAKNSSRNRVQDQRARVSKPQSKEPVKKRFLNPTLQRLQLESLLDEDDESSDHEEHTSSNA